MNEKIIFGKNGFIITTAKPGILKTTNESEENVAFLFISGEKYSLILKSKFEDETLKEFDVKELPEALEEDISLKFDGKVLTSDIEELENYVIVPNNDLAEKVSRECVEEFYSELKELFEAATEEDTKVEGKKEKLDLISIFLNNKLFSYVAIGAILLFIVVFILIFKNSNTIGTIKTEIAANKTNIETNTKTIAIVSGSVKKLSGITENNTKDIKNLKKQQKLLKAEQAKAKAREAKAKKEFAKFKATIKVELNEKFNSQKNKLKNNLDNAIESIKELKNNQIILVEEHCKPTFFLFNEETCADYNAEKKKQKQIKSAKIAELKDLYNKQIKTLEQKRREALNNVKISNSKQIQF